MQFTGPFYFSNDTKAGKNNKAIIIEYKIAKKAEDLAFIAKTGLEQINNQQYDTKIKEQTHVQQIIKISLVFCGKAVAMEYDINDIK